jgi:hypothetical protein
MKAGDKFEELSGEIISIGESRRVETKAGKKINVATAKFKSAETGLVDLTLWADNIIKFKPGDKASLKAVEVKEFKGNFSLNVAPPSKGGSIERV